MNVAIPMALAMIPKIRPALSALDQELNPESCAVAVAVVLVLVEAAMVLLPELRAVLESPTSWMGMVFGVGVGFEVNM